MQNLVPVCSVAISVKSCLSVLILEVQEFVDEEDAFLQVSGVCVCVCVLYLEAAVCSPMVEQSRAVTCLHTVPKSSCLLEGGLVKRSDSYYRSIRVAQCPQSQYRTYHSKYYGTFGWPGLSKALLCDNSMKAVLVNSKHRNFPIWFLPQS